MRAPTPRRLRPVLMASGAVLLIAILTALLVDRGFLHDSSYPADTASGVAATQARSLPPFTGVELAGANNVVVRVGARQAVIVHADRNLLSRVTTRVRSGRLVIGTTPGNLSAKSPMYVAVSVPSLDALRLRGAGNISASGIDSRTLSVALPGSGNIDASGSTMKLDVTLDGEGTALLRRLIARDARTALTGDGTIMLTSTHSLSVSLSGTGTVLYGGNPRHITERTTGSGTITAG